MLLLLPRLLLLLLLPLRVLLLVLVLVLPLLPPPLLPPPPLLLLLPDCASIIAPPVTAFSRTAASEACSSRTGNTAAVATLPSLSPPTLAIGRLLMPLFDARFISRDFNLIVACSRFSWTRLFL